MARMCSAWRVETHIDSLPNDFEALRALALNAIAERDAMLAERDAMLAERDAMLAGHEAMLAGHEALVAERDRLIAHLDRLRHLLKQLQRMQFGRKSEKLDADQLILALEDIEQAIAKAEAAAEKSNPKPRGENREGGRRALPVHLPREHVTIE